jgi:hypothetical protein
MTKLKLSPANVQKILHLHLSNNNGAETIAEHLKLPLGAVEAVLAANAACGTHVRRWTGAVAGTSDSWGMPRKKKVKVKA